MTETAASTMRIAEDGRRMHTAIRLVMEKEITQVYRYTLFYTAIIVHFIMDKFCD